MVPFVRPQPSTNPGHPRAAEVAATEYVRTRRQ